MQRIVAASNILFMATPRVPGVLIYLFQMVPHKFVFAVLTQGGGMLVAKGFWTQIKSEGA